MCGDGLIPLNQVFRHLFVIIVKESGTINAEIFMATIFRGLNFCGGKILMGEVAHEILKNYHENLTPRTLTHETK